MTQYQPSGCDVGALGARQTRKSGDARFVRSAAAIAETLAPKPGGQGQVDRGALGIAANGQELVEIDEI
jgi:hypothetical protein